MALSDEGTLFAWGSSKGGVLGVGFTKETKDYYAIPQRIKAIDKIESKN